MILEVCDQTHMFFTCRMCSRPLRKISFEIFVRIHICSFIWFCKFFMQKVSKVQTSSPALSIENSLWYKTCKTTFCEKIGLQKLNCRLVKHKDTTRNLLWTQDLDGLMHFRLGHSIQLVVCNYNNPLRFRKQMFWRPIDMTLSRENQNHKQNKLCPPTWSLWCNMQMSYICTPWINIIHLKSYIGIFVYLVFLSLKAHSKVDGVFYNSSLHVSLGVTQGAPENIP